MLLGRETGRLQAGQMFLFPYARSKVDQAGTYFDSVVARMLTRDFFIAQAPERKVCAECGTRLVGHTSLNRYGTEYQSLMDLARRRGFDCSATSRKVRTFYLDAQIAEIVTRLSLPDDWRERLEELANHREDRNQIEGKRRYLRGKLRRLRELYLEGDFDKAEYDWRKSEQQAQLEGLRMPQPPDIEQAGETLQSLGKEWKSAPLRYQRDMLRVIFESVYVDVPGRRVVCVKPYPQFAPLFRLDGLEESEDGCFYYQEEEA